MSQQQQNLHEVLQSLQKPDFKSFSIRQYVLAYRQKDFFHNWPFPEKYLQMCLSHGINDALPPFEPHHIAIESIRGLRRLNCSRQSKQSIASPVHRIHQTTVDQEAISKEECNLIKADETVSNICGDAKEDRHLSLSSNTCEHEDNDNHLISDVTSSIIVSKNQPSAAMSGSLLHDHQCNETMNSTKRLRVKRRRHKGRHKKKSVVDILSVAKPCTYEDPLKMKNLYCGLSKPDERMVEEIEEVTDMEKSELTEDCLNYKLHTGNCEGDIDTLNGKERIANLKFSGCSSNSCNMDPEKNEKQMHN
ncbi:hypothetical protein L484_021765 [Morus notabilis]|uniref:Uncharacterized protein n=1 Tax=Morus notabilis TaxID=981085 RepID=W9RWA5_9ROSA|nr:uncharacterized protein LOC21404607 [Morus notabilis]EXC14266.1 hypothetical protein L484_021765 [Morus notabilis]